MPRLPNAVGPVALAKRFENELGVGAILIDGLDQASFRSLQVALLGAQQGSLQRCLLVPGVALANRQMLLRLLDALAAPRHPRRLQANRIVARPDAQVTLEAGQRRGEVVTLKRLFRRSQVMHGPEMPAAQPAAGRAA